MQISNDLGFFLQNLHGCITSDQTCLMVLRFTKKNINSCTKKLFKKMKQNTEVYPGDTTFLAKILQVIGKFFIVFEYIHASHASKIPMFLYSLGIFYFWWAIQMVVELMLPHLRKQNEYSRSALGSLLMSFMSFIDASDDAYIFKFDIERLW